MEKVFVFIVVYILVSKQWYLLVLLISIFLITNVVKRFFMWILAIEITSFVNHLLKSFFFLKFALSILFICKNSLCILDIVCYLLCSKYFLLLHSLPLHPHRSVSLEVLTFKAVRIIILFFFYNGECFWCLAKKSFCTLRSQRNSPVIF